MYDVSQDFLQAAEKGAKQFITGRIAINGANTSIWLDDNGLIGEPEITRQCTADLDVFGVGELVSGTLKFILNAKKASTGAATDEEREYAFNNLRGARVTLDFKLDGASDIVPLGVWTITEPTKKAGGIIEITGEDCISRLNVPIAERCVGYIDLESRLKKITELTGVRFAQTAEQIRTLSKTSLSVIYGTEFCQTCRDEVSAIAGFIGGFACADRHGNIAFRTFGTQSVLTVEAEKRHNIALNDYCFGISGVSYTDKSGNTATVSTNAVIIGTKAVVSMPKSPLIHENNMDSEKAVKQYELLLGGAAQNLALTPWKSGEVEYYGNPALDLGDLVTLRGGSVPVPTPFLITGEAWHFRGAQTLISAGAGKNAYQNGAGQGGSSSHIQQLITQVNVEKNIAVVEMTGYTGVLSDKLQTAALGAFSVREQTIVFVDITANIRSIGNTEVHMNLLFDGVKQTVHAIETMAANQRRTIHLTAHLIASQGKHTVTAEACGNAETERITAIVWGQNITPEKPEPAYIADYEYTVNANSVTIDKYIGDSESPTVPREIKGKQVTVIGSSVFMGTSVKSAYISEGVEEIQ